MLTAHPPPPDLVAVPAHRAAGVLRRLPAGAPAPLPHRRRRVHTGWDWLIDQRGLAPETHRVAGDSAGGHLAVDLLLQPDVRHPAALVLFSPLVDLTFTLARTREQLRRDPAIRSRRRGPAGRVVLRADIESTHPRLTHDVAGGRALPPTLIQAGGAEMLAADAIALAEDIRAAGGDCELQIWPDQVHVFQALPRLTPEAAPAMRRIAAFIANALCDSNHRSSVG